MADQQFRGPDDNPGKYDSHKLIRLGNLGDERGRAAIEANREVLRSMGWSDVTDVTYLRYGEPFDTNGLGVYMGMMPVTTSGPTFIEQVNDDSRVFPEWNPAKHVRPASLRGDTLSWVFCDEAEEDTEGERLARFFATSAHEGHEAVQYERPVVPRPDDKLLDYAGSVCAVTYCQADLFFPFATVTIDGGWACTVYGHEVKPDVALKCAWLQPIIAETQGALRAWEAAMRAGQ